MVFFIKYLLIEISVIAYIRAYWEFEEPGKTNQSNGPHCYSVDEQKMQFSRFNQLVRLELYNLAVRGFRA